MDKLIYKLNTNWFIDKDPENEGAEIGWNEHISNTAVAAYVPSVIQQISLNITVLPFIGAPLPPI